MTASPHGQEALMKQIITLLLSAGLLGSALWLSPAAAALAKVYLHRVITHRGTAVFGRMRWTYGRAGHVLYLRLTSTGTWTY